MKFVQIHCFDYKILGETNDIVSLPSKSWRDMSPRPALKLGSCAEVNIYVIKLE